MPLIMIFLGKGTYTNEKKAELSRKVTDVIVKELKVPQHYTWIIINEIPPENWVIDKLTLPEFKAKLKAEKKA
ncbi:MAG: tautomerase family protein [archaeon GB-1867-035]|nr:tautomerase family protein [Candidatus Culexmicrobium profundum]